MKFLSKRKIANFFWLGLILAWLTLKISVNDNSDITQLHFYWDSINVVIDVQDNGDMLVTETQKYVFNQAVYKERYRYIPLDKVDNITDVSVSENNKILPSQVGKKNNQLWIKWKHKLNPPESYTFKIKYRVVGGLHVNTNDTQVYWEAIFGDRRSPIQNAKVTVKLPKSVAGKIKSYTHYPTSIPVSSQKLDDRTIEFITQEPIPEKELIKVQVSFPNNVLKISLPTWQKNPMFRFLVNLPTFTDQTNGNWSILAIWTSAGIALMGCFISLRNKFRRVFINPSEKITNLDHQDLRNVHCGKCKKSMERVSNLELTKVQEVAMRNGLVNYKGYKCLKCNQNNFLQPYSLIAYIFSFRYRKCPECHQFTVNRTEKTFEQASYTNDGKREVRDSCLCCEYRLDTTTIIPQKRRLPYQISSGGDGGGGG